MKTQQDEHLELDGYRRGPSGGLTIRVLECLVESFSSRICENSVWKSLSVRALEDIGACLFKLLRC